MLRQVANNAYESAISLITTVISYALYKDLLKGQSNNHRIKSAPFSNYSKL